LKKKCPQIVACAASHKAPLLQSYPQAFYRTYDLNSLLKSSYGYVESYPHKMWITKRTCFRLILAIFSYFHLFSGVEALVGQNGYFDQTQSFPQLKN